MWDTEDCGRYASPQILIGNVIFLFIYYFVTFFSGGICCQDHHRMHWYTFFFFSLHEFHLFQNVSLKFLCQVCLLSVWHLDVYVTLGTECIYSVKRVFFPLSFCYQSCRPWYVQLERLAMLISVLHSFLWSWGSYVAGTWGKEVWGKERSCFAFRRPHSHPVAVSPVCAQPGAHQTPFTELSVNVCIGCASNFYC